MRKIPGLSSELVNRGVRLAEKAQRARDAAPVTPPSASISPAKLVDGVATLRLYDYIDGEGGYWGISANEVADALDAIEGDVSRIELRINSGGGSVWDGLAILNTLRAHDAKVTAVVDGIAASAASFIAVACDETVMMPNSKMMIHDAMGICLGQAVDMREYADFLDESSNGIAEIYAAKAGGTVDEWRATMTEKGLMGTWYGAQDAVDAKLADRVDGQTEDDQAPADKAPAQPPAAVTSEPADDGAAKVAALVARHRENRHKLNARRHGFTSAGK